MVESASCESTRAAWRSRMVDRILAAVSILPVSAICCRISAAARVKGIQQDLLLEAMSKVNWGQIAEDLLAH